MKIKDRIIDFRRVKAKLLKPNPKNWRTHPEKQKNILKGVLSEIGYADALLARELENGELELIDGHLRAETTPEQDVPILVLDLSEDEANKLLVLLDPLASYAGTDQNLLSELIANVDTQNDAILEMLNDLQNKDIEIDNKELEIKDLDVPQLYQILIDCESESQQEEIFEELRSREIKCKILNL